MQYPALCPAIKRVLCTVCWLAWAGCGTCIISTKLFCCVHSIVKSSCAVSFWQWTSAE